MADGSVREGTGREFIHSASVGMKGDYYMEFGIPTLVIGSASMVEYAKEMAGWARATLYVARLRGEDDSDLPGTMDNALAAAEFLFQLAAGLEEAASRLKQDEDARGVRSHG